MHYCGSCDSWVSIPLSVHWSNGDCELRQELKSVLEEVSQVRIEEEDRDAFSFADRTALQEAQKQPPLRQLVPWLQGIDL